MKAIATRDIQCRSWPRGSDDGTCALLRSDVLFFFAIKNDRKTKHGLDSLDMSWYVLIALTPVLTANNLLSSSYLHKFCAKEPFTLKLLAKCWKSLGRRATSPQDPRHNESMPRDLGRRKGSIWQGLLEQLGLQNLQIRYMTYIYIPASPLGG